jgi:hypothetical protein
MVKKYDLRYHTTSFHDKTNFTFCLLCICLFFFFLLKYGDTPLPSIFALKEYDVSREKKFTLVFTDKFQINKEKLLREEWV